MDAPKSATNPREVLANAVEIQMVYNVRTNARQMLSNIWQCYECIHIVHTVSRNLRGYFALVHIYDLLVLRYDIILIKIIHKDKDKKIVKRIQKTALIHEVLVLTGSKVWLRRTTCLLRGTI